MSREQADHICPPWIGRLLLANPLRSVLHTPKSILSPHVAEGMTVIEPGPGMGFFTLELARLVGPNGRVITLDIQARMLEVLRNRARRAGVSDRVETRLVTADSLGIEDMRGRADFFLAYAMVHEVPDPLRYFQQAHEALRPGGRLLFAEPKIHIAERLFSRELEFAVAAGFSILDRPSVRMSRAAVLVK